MAVSRYPYKLMEVEFVKSDDLSIREIGRRHGIPAERISSVHEWARKHGWEEKRLERQHRTSDKTLEALAELEAKRRLREAQVFDNFIDLVDEAITKVRSDIFATKQVKGVDGNMVEEPVMRLRPKEITDLIDSVSTVFGRQSAGGEALPSGSGNGFIQITAGGDTATGLELLERLRASAAGDGAARPEPRRVTSSALPTAPDGSQDQLA